MLDVEFAPSNEAYRPILRFLKYLDGAFCDVCDLILCHILSIAHTISTASADVHMTIWHEFLPLAGLQVVALDKAGAAEGELYLDDGRSFGFQRGAFLHRALRFAGGRLSSSAAESARGSPLTLPLSGAPFSSDVAVERIVVLGLPGGPANWKVRLIGLSVNP